MREHSDTNVGPGMVYDTPEEKEIERLSAEVRFLHEVIRDMRMENRLHGHITDASAKYIHRYPRRAAIS